MYFQKLKFFLKIRMFSWNFIWQIIRLLWKCILKQMVSLNIETDHLLIYLQGIVYTKRKLNKETSNWQLSFDFYLLKPLAAVRNYTYTPRTPRTPHTPHTPRTHTTSRVGNIFRSLLCMKSPSRGEGDNCRASRGSGAAPLISQIIG